MLTVSYSLNLIMINRTLEFVLHESDTDRKIIAFIPSRQRTQNENNTSPILLDGLISRTFSWRVLQAATTTLLSAMVDQQRTWTRPAMLPLQLLCVQTSHMTGMGGEKHIHILRERLCYLEQSNTTDGLS